MRKKKILNNHLAKLVLSNLAEVEARQGQTFIFTNKKIPKKNKKVEIIKMPDCPDLIVPILYITSKFSNRSQISCAEYMVPSFCQ